MKLGIRLVCVLVLAGTFQFSLKAQQSSPYILNGSARSLSCNCYQLTTEDTFQAGSVWNKNQIDLNNSFNYVFNVYLGTKDAQGADGIVFILQQIGTSVGNSGQGLGFQNIVPSIGIPIDTWQNFDFLDPSYDHVGIYKNGDLVNGTSNTLAGPVQALQNSPNIEDGQWHTFRIIWDQPTKTLSAEIDGIPRVQATVDLVSDVFKNNSRVYWGFSGATGGQTNIQKVCTSLNPAFSFPPGTNFCAPATITFNDSSTSFGTVTNWWWDFGDGKKDSVQKPAPHAYPAPGNYIIKMNIEANNGCTSDTLFKKITIGSIPTASFTSSPAVICTGDDALLISKSSVEFGTINEWDWNFNQGAELIQSADSALWKNFPEGPLQIRLIVKTLEGCVSDPVSKTMDITTKPSINITVEDVCYRDPALLTSTNLTPSIPVRQWYWFTGDDKVDSTSSVYHIYPDSGNYTVGVYALNENGCSSDTMTAIVTIYRSNAKLGNDTVVAFNQPLQLHATGGAFYQWTPAAGLNDPTSANPVAILQHDQQYILKAYTDIGCATYDSIFIKAYKGPDIYVPNAFTPDHNGHNDYFHPVLVGISRIDYFEVFNRVGQKVFSSSGSGPGWDGNLNGSPQPVGTYVWIIKGLDYLGNFHSEKGTVVLIR